jgi:hypothetical protein
VAPFLQPQGVHGEKDLLRNGDKKQIFFIETFQIIYVDYQLQPQKEKLTCIYVQSEHRLHSHLCPENRRKKGKIIKLEKPEKHLSLI